MRMLVPFLLFAFTPTLLAQEPTQPLAWQWLGEFHGEETRARDGETWFALRHEGARTWLEPVVVRVEAIHDPILDGDDERSGRRVSTPSLGEEPLALLRGAGLVAGSLSSAERGALPLVPGSWRRIETRAIAAVELLLDCDVSAPDAPFECELTLRNDVLEQVLHTFSASRSEDGQIMLGDDGGAELRFAGDLDRDGRMDLVLDLRDHYNVQRTEVWLSGGDANGDLLRLATAHETTGC